VTIYVVYFPRVGLYDLQPVWLGIHPTITFLMPELVFRKLGAHVEAGQNTSTVALQVVRGYKLKPVPGGITGPPWEI
jgi:hypothetical protein